MSLSGAVAGVKMFNGWAIVSILAGVLSAFVVMCLTPPRDKREWFVCLTTTAVSSICGGAYVIIHLGIQHWAFDYFGLVAMFGLVFVCGLPGWATVRWLFNYVNKHRNDDISEVGKDLRNKLRGK